MYAYTHNVHVCIYVPPVGDRDLKTHGLPGAEGSWTPAKEADNNHPSPAPPPPPPTCPPPHPHPHPPHCMGRSCGSPSPNSLSPLSGPFLGVIFAGKRCCKSPPPNVGPLSGSCIGPGRGRSRSVKTICICYATTYSPTPCSRSLSCAV